MSETPCFINQIFIGGLDITVTKQDLTDLFSPYGKIDYIRIKIKKKKQRLRESQSYATVQMSPESCRKILEKGSFQIRGRHVRCIPNLKGKQLHEYLRLLNQRSIFVSGIPVGTRLNDLRSLLLKHGRIVNFSWLKEPTDMQVGIGCLVFSKQSEAAELLEKSSTFWFKGQLLNCKIKGGRRKKKLKKEEAKQISSNSWATVVNIAKLTVGGSIPSTQTTNKKKKLEEIERNIQKSKGKTGLKRGDILLPQETFLQKMMRTTTYIDIAKQYKKNSNPPSPSFPLYQSLLPGVKKINRGNQTSLLDKKSKEFCGSQNQDKKNIEAARRNTKRKL